MSQSVPLPPDQAYRPIQHIGGARGYYYATWIWRMRGILDQLVGGVGYRRGRRDPSRIRVGEPLDFWRVEAHEPGRRLLLRAEMRLPGRAWLEFQVEPEDQVGSGVPRSRIHQTAVFDPRGLLGRLYWWSVYPLHAWIFGGMVRRIARIAMLSAGPTKEAQASGPRHAILKGERA